MMPYRFNISILKKHIQCIALMLVLGSGVSWGSAPNVTIYFYHPESNVNRNAVLKHKFEQYFADKGGYLFQPVDDKSTFESLFSSDPNALFLMSHQYFQFVKDHVAIQAKLIGSSSGSITYKQLLVTRQGGFDGKNVITIAAAGVEPLATQLLQEIEQNSGHALPTVRLLMVPKDIDALMAVGFGMADGAIASELSLNKLSTLYQQQYQQLENWGVSNERTRITLAVPKAVSASLEQAVQAIYVMEKSIAGRIRLGLLGLDGWQPVTVQSQTKREGAQ